MIKNKNHNKYFVYGCDELLNELLSIVDSAASAELRDCHAAEWLFEEYDIPITSMVTWGDAIRYILMQRLRRIKGSKKTKKELNEPPF